MNNLLNNSYTVGIGTRNLVLNTFGRVYVKVNDRYYELDFKNKQTSDSESLPEIIVLDSASDVDKLTYPGDNKLIITLDGKIYITQNANIIPINIVPSQEIGIELDKLTVNGSIKINTNDNIPPFLINSSALVSNLNTQYLNGYKSDDFALKNNSEIITGKWSFNLPIIAKEIINNNTVLDLQNSSLSIDNINVRKNITIPNNLLYKEEVVEGIREREYINKKLFVNTAIRIDYTDYYNTPIIEINRAYGIYLNNIATIQTWYNIFLSNYTSGSENDPNYVAIIRDLNLESEKQTANQIISDNNIPGIIDDYMYTFYNFYIEDINYNSSVYEVNLKNIINYTDLLVNDIVSIAINDLIYNGKIVRIDGSIIYIGFPQRELNIAKNSFFVISHSILGAIKLESTIDIFKDFELKIRFGNLRGIEDSIFGKLYNTGGYLNGDIIQPLSGNSTDNIKNYAYNSSGIHIKNANIAFGDQLLFNPDGSGMISNGKIRWDGSGNITIDGAVLANTLTIITNTDTYTYDGTQNLTVDLR